MGQELVAQPLALARPFDEAGDVDELDRGGNDDPRFRDLLQMREARVRHVHDPDVGVDGAERVIGRLGLPGAGDGIEQCGLADVRQSDDSSSQHDGISYQLSAYQLESAVQFSVPSSQFSVLGYSVLGSGYSGYWLPLIRAES